MKKEQAHRLALLPTFGLAAVLVIASPAAAAQETAKPVQPEALTAMTATTAAVPSPTARPARPDQEEMDAAGEIAYGRLQIGDATQGLLAWQRSGEIASPAPRPIAGDVASRSYERYLKSFEFPIPERMSSIVKSSSVSGAGAPK